MSNNTAEEAFELFVKCWKERSPKVHLDNEEVREKIMALVSSSLVLLDRAPEAFQSFYRASELAMLDITPPRLLREIATACANEPTN